MKQETAVEWLIKKLELDMYQDLDDNTIKIIEQAKEMEKEQMNKCYSEEEVIDLLQKMNDWPTICEGRSDIEEWFEQFKKKIKYEDSSRIIG
jgi:hypothetical protein